jgi:hypothetical protein
LIDLKKCSASKEKCERSRQRSGREEVVMRKNTMNKERK